jgi:hypothetical protein
MDKTPLKIIPNVAQSHAACSLIMSFDQQSGWIIGESPKLAADQQITKLCWLPVELRGQYFATHDERTIVIVSSFTQQFTIIDLGPMLDMLCKLGLI